MSIKKLFLVAITVLSVSAAHASIVTNGGFESGLTGWTTSVNNGSVGAGSQGPAAFEGASYFWGFDNQGPGTLQQILSTNIGAIYQIALAFNTNGAVPPNSLAISAGDLSESLNLATGLWTTYTSTFTASSTSTALNFFFNTVSGSGTVWIDAVSVEQVGQVVPEPAAMALFGFGLAVLGAVRRRQTK